MENKILHTILLIIKNAKMKGTSYYLIKRKIMQLKLEINLNDYLNHLIKKKCIQKKKNRYFYLENTIENKLELLIDEDESDSEIDPIMTKKNIFLDDKEDIINKSDNSTESSDEYSDIDDHPYFVFGDEDLNNGDNFNDNNIKNLSLLLNMLSDQIELDVLDFNDDNEEFNSSSESSKDNHLYNSEEEEYCDIHDKKKELKFHDKKDSAKIKLNVRMDDIELMKDGIIQNKIKPEKDEYEINVDIPFDFIYKILKYIK